MTDTGIGFVFFLLDLPNQTHRARSGSLTTNGSRAADLDERALQRTATGWPLSSAAGEPELVLRHD